MSDLDRDSPRPDTVNHDPDGHVPDGGIKRLKNPRPTRNKKVTTQSSVMDGSEDQQIAVMELRRDLLEVINRHSGRFGFGKGRYRNVQEAIMDCLLITIDEKVQEIPPTDRACIDADGWSYSFGIDGIVTTEKAEELTGHTRQWLTKKHRDHVARKAKAFRQIVWCVRSLRDAMLPVECIPPERIYKLKK